MIKRIVLENFMSHRRTVIEPAMGLTVLTGPNNCGKSAVVLALQILCSNESGAHRWTVRHGAKYARIMVETDEPHRIEWVYESGKVHYAIDGVRTDRLNRGLPDNLMPSLRLPKVSGDDGKTFDIHVAEQKNPIFLIEGGSRAATFFAASTDAGYLVKMQQLLRSKKGDLSRDARFLTGQIDGRKLELAKLDLVPDIEFELGLCTKSYEELCAAEETRAALFQLMGRTLDLGNQIEQSAAIAQAAEHLSPPPTLEDESALRRLTADLALRADHHDRATALLSQYEELAGPPDLHDERPLSEAVEGIEAKAAHVDLLSARLACVAELPSPPELVADPYLSTTLGLIESLEQKRTQIDRELSAAMAELEKHMGIMDGFFKENPSCPVCGGEISKDAVLDGEHRHPVAGGAL